MAPNAWASVQAFCKQIDSKEKFTVFIEFDDETKQFEMKNLDDMQADISIKELLQHLRHMGCTVPIVRFEDIRDGLYIHVARPNH